MKGQAEDNAKWVAGEVAGSEEARALNFEVWAT